MALVFATTEAERRPVTSVYIEIQQWKSWKGGHTYDGLRSSIFGSNDTWYHYLLVNSLYKSIKKVIGGPDKMAITSLSNYLI